MSQPVVQIPGGWIDLRTQTASLRGALTRLSAQEICALELLIGAGGAVVPRESMLTQALGLRRMVKTRAADLLICRLRQKIELAQAAPRVILTVPGQGHRWGLAGGGRALIGREAATRDVAAGLARGRLILVRGEVGAGSGAVARAAVGRLGVQAVGVELGWATGDGFEQAMVLGLGARELGLWLDELGSGVLLLHNPREVEAAAWAAVEAWLAQHPSLRVILTGALTPPPGLAGVTVIDLSPLDDADALTLLARTLAAQDAPALAWPLLRELGAQLGAAPGLASLLTTRALGAAGAVPPRAGEVEDLAALAWPPSAPDVTLALALLGGEAPERRLEALVRRGLVRVLSTPELRVVPIERPPFAAEAQDALRARLGDWLKATALARFGPRDDAAQGALRRDLPLLTRAVCDVRLDADARAAAGALAVDLLAPTSPPELLRAQVEAARRATEAPIAALAWASLLWEDLGDSGDDARAQVAALCERCEDPVRAWAESELAAALLSRGALDEGVALVRRALARPSTRRHTVLRALLLFRLAGLLSRRGGEGASGEVDLCLLRVRRLAQGRSARMSLLVNLELGVVGVVRGDLGSAIPALEQVIADGGARDRLLAEGFLNLATLLSGHVEEARARGQAALRRAMMFGGVSHRARAISTLAVAEAALGDLDAALPRLALAQQICEEAALERSVAMLRGLRAIVYARLHAPDLALDALGEDAPEGDSERVVFRLARAAIAGDAAQISAVSASPEARHVNVRLALRALGG